MRPGVLNSTLLCRLAPVAHTHVQTELNITVPLYQVDQSTNVQERVRRLGARVRKPSSLLASD